MKIVISAILFIVSSIHLLPVMGVLGSDSLTKLYGVSTSDSNTEILLRHRAVLFAIIGLFLLLSVFKSNYQPIAICMGFISVASFLLLTWLIDGLNSEISRVAKVDWVALVLLIVAGVVNILN
jgi:peptidoglycan/LPS O-acetylase OafA/YrhL